MKLNTINLFIYFLLGAFVFAACTKNDQDITEIIEEDVIPEVVNCDTLEVEISELPDGSGNLLAVVRNATTQQFTYEWSTGETTPDIDVSTDGTYSVTITDPEGCTGVGTYNVTLDPCLDFELMIEEDSSGTLTAIVSGGTPAYAYEWSTGEISASIVATAGETYLVTVTDAQGCNLVSSITTDGPDECDGFTVTVFPDQINQYLIASPSGGTIPYTFLWSTGDESSATLIVGSGVYTVIVSDANGCRAEYSYVIQ